MFDSIKEIEIANKNIGHHWFDKGTKRFFKSHIHSEVYGGKYFISSENTYDGRDRKFTIRIARENGSVSTVGEFQEFSTVADARARINELLKGE